MKKIKINIRNMSGKHLLSEMHQSDRIMSNAIRRKPRKIRG